MQVFVFFYGGTIMEKMTSKMLLGTGFLALSLSFFAEATLSHSEIISRIQNKLAFSLGSMDLGNKPIISQAIFDANMIKGLVDEQAQSSTVVPTSTKKKLDHAFSVINEILEELIKYGLTKDKDAYIAKLKAAQKHLTLKSTDATTPRELKNALDIAIESFISNLNLNYPSKKK